MRTSGTGRRRTLIGALALAAAALGAGVGLAVNAAGSDVPAAPPPPPWVRPDGTVDASRMPARVGLVGFDGKPVLDARGRPVTVPFGAPGPGGSNSAATASDALQRADAAARGIPIPPAPQVTQSP